MQGKVEFVSIYRMVSFLIRVRQEAPSRCVYLYQFREPSLCPLVAFMFSLIGCSSLLLLDLRIYPFPQVIKDLGIYDQQMKNYFSTTDFIRTSSSGSDDEAIGVTQDSIYRIPLGAKQFRKYYAAARI